MLKLRENNPRHALSELEASVRRAAEWTFSKVGMEGPTADSRTIRTLKKRWEIPKHGEIVDLAVLGEWRSHSWFDVTNA